MMNKVSEHLGSCGYTCTLYPCYRLYCSAGGCYQVLQDTTPQPQLHLTQTQQRWQQTLYVHCKNTPSVLLIAKVFVV